MNLAHWPRPARPEGWGRPRRRDLLAGLAVLALLALLAAGSLHSARHDGTPKAEVGAEAGAEAVVLDWSALRPPAERDLELPRGEVDHAWLMARRLSGRPLTMPGSGQTIAAHDGRRVRLSGYAMPADGGGTADAGRFLLVPYFGACAHVPPPPINQTVLVRTGAAAAPPMFSPVEVVGLLRRAARRTHLDRAGYVIEAEAAAPPQQ